MNTEHLYARNTNFVDVVISSRAAQVCDLAEKCHVGTHTHTHIYTHTHTHTHTHTDANSAEIACTGYYSICISFHLFDTKHGNKKF